MIRPAFFVLLIATAFGTLASAPGPADFGGRWIVSRRVGSAAIGTGADYHAALGTVVTITPSMVTDAEGNCAIVNPRVEQMSNDRLQHDVWGGQTIGGLMLPRRQIESVFGATHTPVYEDDNDCLGLVMLDRNHALFSFTNAALYELTRQH